jgi:hypothetical protein
VSDRDLLAAPARRLGDALVAAGRVRAPIAQILSCWDAAMPELRTHGESHTRLVDALHELAEADVIVLPAGSWDRTCRPALPKFVTVPAARRPRRATPWRTFPWRAELGWAASMPTMTGTQFEALVAVNDWLTSGGDDMVAPARIRSAELWGDEKLIDSIVLSAIWGEGKLTWDLIAAERLPPPLVIRRVSAGPELLVVENLDPFWLCARLLADTDSPIGRVAWGAGSAFMATAPSIAEEAVLPTRIWYWGDGDPDGVRIPTSAAGLIEAAGLPPMEPHPGLWAAYTGLKVHEPGRHHWTAVSSAWLRPAAWQSLAQVRVAGGRVAQESVAHRTVATILR